MLPSLRCADFSPSEKQQQNPEKESREISCWSPKGSRWRLLGKGTNRDQSSTPRKELRRAGEGGGLSQQRRARPGATVGRGVTAQRADRDRFPNPVGFAGIPVAAPGGGSLELRFFCFWFTRVLLICHPRVEGAAMSSVQVLYPPKIHHTMLNAGCLKDDPTQGKRPRRGWAGGREIERAGGRFAWGDVLQTPLVWGMHKSAYGLFQP